MPETPLVIVGANHLKEEAKKVALKTARELVPKLADEDRSLDEIDKIRELFYMTSGLRLIFQQIIDDGIIRNSVDGIFVEFSTPLSTLESQEEDRGLDSFTLVWQSENEDNREKKSLKANVENNFGSIINVLRETKNTVFNHPDFFLQSKKFEQLISVIDNGIISKYEKTGRMYNKRQSDKQDAFRSVIEKGFHHKYNNQIQNIKNPPATLYQHKDKTQNRNVYINASILKGIKYEDIISDETLDGHRSKSLYELHLLSHCLFDDFFSVSNPNIYTEPSYRDRRTFFISLPIVSSKSKLSSTSKNKTTSKTEISSINIEDYIKGNKIGFDNLIYEGIGAVFIYLVLKNSSDLLNENINIEYSENLVGNLVEKVTEKIIEKLKKMAETLPPILKDYVHGYAMDITKEEKINAEKERDNANEQKKIAEQQRKEAVEQSKRADKARDSALISAEKAKEMKVQAVKYAVQASINQVFARNMSHNIGSHVSYRATNLQVKKRAKDFPEIPKNFDSNSPIFADWLDFFSEKLDKYEIYRNEYLSDFDSSPKSVKFYENIVLPFCENTLVLDNIAAGENLNYQDVKNNRLKIKCLIDGNEVEATYSELKNMFSDSEDEPVISYPNNFPYLICSKKANKLTEKEEGIREEGKLATALNKKKISENDVEVCIHSEQAIYSILENFIRNSAKHGAKTEELIIHLDLRKDIESKYYNLYIYDNRSKVKPAILYNEDERKLGIHQKIDQSFLDKTGKPRKANWGFADMKINSFLLFNDFESIEDEKLASNLKIVIKNGENNNLLNFEEVTKDCINKLDTDKEYDFGYKIKISIPKKILWIGEFELDNKTDFENQGLEFVESLEKLEQASEKWEGLKSFQFAVINDKFNYDDYLKIEEKLPGRVIVLNGDENLEVKPSVFIYSNEIDKNTLKSGSTLLKWCWQKWLTRAVKNVDLYLYFDNKEVAKKWSSSNVDLGENLNFYIVNDLTNKSLESENTTNIIYDHHGNAFQEKKGKAKYLNKKTPEFGEMNFATKHSIICFGGGSEDFSALNYPPSESEDKEQLLFQRIDAATTNVFIIDERISDFALNEFTNRFQPHGLSVGSIEIQKSNWNMYATGKVFVIHEIKNGDYSCKIGKAKEDEGKLTLDISDEKMVLSTKMFNLKKIDNVRKDILIVHRTYLDENRVKLEPKQFLERLKKVFGSVFITSGGGYPHNLDVNCRFLSFSSLESCVNSQLAKNKLNNILRTNIK